MWKSGAKTVAFHPIIDCSQPDRQLRRLFNIPARTPAFCLADQPRNTPPKGGSSVNLHCMFQTFPNRHVGSQASSAFSLAGLVLKIMSDQRWMASFVSHLPVWVREGLRKTRMILLMCLGAFAQPLLATPALRTVGRVAAVGRAVIPLWEVWSAEEQQQITSSRSWMRRIVND